MQYRKAPAAALVLLLVTISSASATEIVKGPYLQSATSTGVTVMWEADKAGDASVAFGPTEALGKTVPAVGQELLRKVRLDGLQANSVYYYRVVDGDAKIPTYSFKTLPDTGKFTFAVYGDSRDGASEHALIVSLIEKHDPAFVMHTGDFVWDGRQAELWGPIFFEPARTLISRVALFAAAGNHEHESPLYYKYLGAPPGKPWYSFDCANAHLVMLDSCVDIGPGSEQLKWLEADLASTDKRWRFVTLHYPLYSSSEHGRYLAMRDTLEPIFEKYGVDIVFAGHVHAYERSYPVARADGKGHPITYVVTGGGGARRHEVGKDFFTAKAVSDFNFCVVRIDGDALGFVAHTDDGHELDSFKIVKEGDGYKGDYLAKTAPLELAAAEAVVEKMLQAPPHKAAEGVLDVEYDFAAPAWSSLTLDIDWVEPDGSSISPSTTHLEIPAGQTAKAPVKVKSKSPDTAPGASVKGATSLGTFTFETEPPKLKDDGE